MSRNIPGNLLIEASLVAPISIAIPGFALIYTKMWIPLLTFSILLIISGYYVYSNAINEKPLIIGSIIFVLIHLLSLSYIAVVKSKVSK
jgi:hypothetical protein